MIRIKNIARKNKKCRTRVYDLIYPNGQKGRLRRGKEATIDYETYMLNKKAIVLPGEPMRPTTYFRVISGVEIIGKHNGSRLEAAEAPAIEQEPVEPPLDEIVEEPAETVDNAVEEKLVEAVDSVVDDEIVDDSDKEVGPEPEEPESEEENLDMTLLTHKELDVLLDKAGITVPPRSNKRQKIDALTNLPG
jgi:hypothetical protein